MPSKPLSRKLKVGVMRGGPSSEYDVSLKTGKNVIDSLRTRDHYEVRDIFIDKDGAWHIDGLPRTIGRIAPHIDVVVNALHGAFGEDGRVQKLLDSHNIPYTGSGSLASAMGMNKTLSKKHFRMHGLLIPEHVVIQREENKPGFLQKIISKFPHLKLVKPVSSGASRGISRFNNLDELKKAVDRAFEHADSVLVEEYIKGREATCGVLEGSGFNEIHALHPIEIRSTNLIYPGSFSPDESSLMQRAAITAHQALGLRHYSVSDFIVNRIGVYILEVNTLPSLETSAIFPKALSATGITTPEFLDHIINLALERR